MLFKEPGDTAVITIKSMYIEILDNFLIQLTENRFDGELFSYVLLQSRKYLVFFFFFLQERHIKSITWRANSSNINPLKNYDEN